MPFKKTKIWILFILISYNIQFGLAQACFPDGLRLASQAEVDNFSAQYPDCTIIEGDLCIGNCNSPTNSSDISNLDGLNQLEAVLGKLDISGNDFLTDVSGLSSLRTLAGDFDVTFNDQLTNLIGLDSITRIGGTIDIFANCTSCFRLQGLEQLEVIGGSLSLRSGSFNNTALSYLTSIDSIHGNISVSRTNLSNLQGISSLRYLGGGITMHEDGLTMEGLENLTEIFGNISLFESSTSFKGLENVKIIHGDVRLNESFSQFSGLSNLEEIMGDLYLNFVSSTSLVNLQKLKKIGGNFTLFDTNAIESFTGCDNLTSIGGNFNLNKNGLLQEVLGFASLDSIYGNFSINNHFDMDSLRGFDALTYLGGNFSVTNNIRLSGLGIPKNLETIAGNIYVREHDDLTRIFVPSKLKHLGGFDIQSTELVTTLSTPASLDYLGNVYLRSNSGLKVFSNTSSNTIMPGDFEVVGNGNLESIVGFEAVEQIQGNFEVWINSDLEKLTGFANCQKVGGDLVFKSNSRLDYLAGFQALDSIIGAFDFSHGHYDSLAGFDQLAYVGDDITLNRLLGMEDLFILENLDSIRGTLMLFGMIDLKSFEAIDHIAEIGGALDLSSLPSLPSMQSLHFLQSINGFLSVSNLDSIKNFQGLEAIDRLDGHLRIAYNDQLNSLKGLDNLDPYSITNESSFGQDLTILSNDSLAFCSEPFICEFLDINTKRFRLEENLYGCNSPNEIDCRDFGIRGNVFFDANQNKIKDNNESGIEGIELSVFPNSIVIITDQNGNYILPAMENETYQITAELNGEWILTTDNSTYNRTFISGEFSNSKNDFGLYPVEQKLELQATLTWEPFKCDESTRFYINFQNTGTQTIKGSVQLDYDNIVDYLSSTGFPNSSFNKLVWNFEDLHPGSYRTFYANFRLPENSLEREIVPFTVSSQINNMGTLIPMDSVFYHPILHCGQSENYKIVLPVGKGEEHFIKNNTPLTYTIQFQNKGTTPAIDLVVLDSISPHLDINSINVLQSSAPVNTSIDGDLVTFLFKDIWIRDSLNNAAESSGFVSYSVDQKADLPDFTRIENRADLNFDNGYGQSTNTAFNTIFADVCNDVVVNIDTTICEGETYNGNSISGIYRDTININFSCDSIIETSLTVHEQFDLSRSFVICKDSSFVFNGNVFSPDTSTTILDTAYHASGCILYLFDYEVTVIQPMETNIDTTICEGQSFMGFSTTGDYVVNELDSMTQCYNTTNLQLTIIPAGDPFCLSGTSNLLLPDILLYPSPSKKLFYVESDMRFDAATLYDLNGIVVDQWDLKGNGRIHKILLNPTIADGLYLLQLNQGSSSWFRKVQVIK